MGIKTKTIKRILSKILVVSMAISSISMIGAKKTDAAGITLLNTYGEYMGRIGVCATPNQLRDSKTLAHIKQQYNSITLENQMKPDAILGSGGWWNVTKSITVQEARNNGYVVPDGVKEANLPYLNFSTVDEVLKICHDNNIGLRGHTLVWHSQTPDWFFREDYDTNKAYVSKEVMDIRTEYFVKSVIDHVCKSQYADSLYAWDVVNEYLNAQNSGWRSIYGSGSTPSFVKDAFIWADEILKKHNMRDKVSLINNDYNTYMHTQAMINLVNFINSDGRVCDGIGMQSHLNTKYPTIDGYLNTMKSFLDAGYEVQVTELDVVNDNNDNDTAATYYHDLMKGILELKKQGKKITGITYWGISDENTWINGKQPLLFSKLGVKKAAYDKVMEAFDEVVGLPEVGEDPVVTGNIIKNNGFESGTDGWSARGGASIKTDSSTVKSGSNSLKVSDRTGTWHGAIQDITGMLSAGKTYDLSAAFRFNSSDNPGVAGETEFELSLAFGDGTFGNMATVKTGPDKWAVLSGQYTVPASADLSSVSLIVETLYTDNPAAQDIVSFYVDDIKVEVTGQSASPTKAPTSAPTKAPTQVPTKAPTQAPTTAPTKAPTEVPTVAPTSAPTEEPSQVPAQSAEPTAAPTNEPEATKAPDTGNDISADVTEGTSIKVGKYTYKVLKTESGKEEAAITGANNKNIKIVTVPATVKIDGKTFKVTAVAAGAFKNYKKLSKVTIGKNVTKIEKNAFGKCKALKKIIIKSKKIKVIAKKAFVEINKKARYSIPASKKSIYNKMLF